MDQLKNYRDIIQSELEERATYEFLDEPEMYHQLIIDPERNHFLLLSMGWLGKKYLNYIVYHFEIKEDKVWVHQDNTDVGIAEIIANRGIPKSSIVLGYFPKYAREFSDYAVT